MALLTQSWLLDLTTLIVIAITLILSWLKHKQNYWQRKGIPTNNQTLPFGNAKGIFSMQEAPSNFTLRLYQYFKGEQHGGIYIFSLAMYLPIDLEITKNILQNDFNHFVDRGVYFNEEDDPLSAHLFAIEGAKWKQLRNKLSPTFTSGKMKMMFETLVACGDQLKTELDKGQVMDAKDILGRFTTDIIGNCAFGIDCNSLKNPDNEFSNTLKTFFIGDLWYNLKGFVAFVSPSLARKLRICVTKAKVTKFFMKVVKDTIKYREESNIYRKDFMHLLLQLKNRGELVDDQSVTGGDNKTDVHLTVNEVAAQAFVFFLAGYETSSTTMTFCLYELATNWEIQEKLRKEVKEVLEKHDNTLTYDAVMDMHYMDKVINETLRKYPPLSNLHRICTKEYKVPGTDLVLEKGTPVWIPVYGIHHDPDIYPDPEKFDPERFSEENKKDRHPCAFIPFGEGPRICIGLRFGMMQTKVGLSVLLSNYKFTINPKTHVPLKMDPKSFILSSESGVWLDYEKI